MVWYEFVWFSHNSEAEFTTMNIGRGYVINVGRGYVINVSRGYIITRVGIELLGQLKNLL